MSKSFTGKENRIWLAVFLTALVWVLMLPRTVHAESGFVSMRFHESAAGAEVSLYRFADYQEGQFVVGEDFRSAGFSLNMLEDAEKVQVQAELLATIAIETGTEGVSGTIEPDGILQFTDLPAGIYVLNQKSGQEFVTLQKALIPIPYTDADGLLHYEVYADYSTKYSIPNGAAIMYKVDDDGVSVEGAVFELQKKVYLPAGMEPEEDVETGVDVEGTFSWTTIQKDLVSNQNGEIAFEGLEFGMYRLRETSAPKGFWLNKADQYFSVDTAGTIELQEDGKYGVASGEVPEVTVVNEQTKVEVNKVDESGNPLAGARLTIKDAEGNPLLNEDGSMKYDLTSAEEPIVVKQLPAGEYFLSELETPKGYKVAEDVPFTVEINKPVSAEVTMVDEKEEASDYSLKVTKHLTDLDGHSIMAMEDAFFVALFADEELTQRVSEVKTLNYKRQTSQIVDFENLIAGQVYYISETDMFGNPLVGEILDILPFMPFYDSHTIIIDTEKQDYDFDFTNMFNELPGGYFYTGTLEIVKQVLRGNEPYGVEETYYAGVFEDEACTELFDIIALEMDGESELSVTIEVPLENEVDASKTYYIKETDENGVPLVNGRDIPFTVEVSDEAIAISVEGENKVVITNTYPMEEVAAPPFPDGYGPSNGSGSGGSSPVKTGDDTPIAALIGALAAAAIVIGIVLKKKKK